MGTAAIIAQLALQFGLAYLQLRQQAQAEGRDISAEEVAKLRKQTDDQLDALDATLAAAAKEG